MNLIPRSRLWRRFFLPLSVTLLSLFTGCLFGVLPGWLVSSAGVVFALGLLYFLVCTLVFFFRRQWKTGFGFLGCGASCLVALVPASFLMMMSSMADVDDFADDLVLPEGVELQSPAERSHRNRDTKIDGDLFQQALMHSLNTPGTNNASITPAISALADLQSQHSELLRRYLATNPAWWYHKNSIGEYATRRWKSDGHWRHRLHGHYSSFFPKDDKQYQSRTCLRLAGKRWFGKGQEFTSGTTGIPTINAGNDLNGCSIYWEEGDITVEMFEQSSTKERRLIKAAIGQLNAEFNQLLEKPSWDTAKAMLPAGAFILGEQPKFELSNGMQGGVYRASIYCNPGEPGNIYLKAFEITKGSALSKQRLKDRTSEFVGWSNNTEEQFFSSVEFSIYEGNWGQYYGARFELWFSPQGSGKDRKLMESNWKIEGWMR